MIYGLDDDELMEENDLLWAQAAGTKKANAEQIAG